MVTMPMPTTIVGDVVTSARDEDSFLGSGGGAKIFIDFLNENFNIKNIKFS